MPRVFSVCKNVTEIQLTPYPSAEIGPKNEKTTNLDCPASKFPVVFLQEAHQVFLTICSVFFQKTPTENKFRIRKFLIRFGSSSICPLSHSVQILAFNGRLGAKLKRTARNFPSCPFPNPNLSNSNGIWLGNQPNPIETGQVRVSNWTTSRGTFQFFAQAPVGRQNLHRVAQGTNRTTPKADLKFSNSKFIFGQCFLRKKNEQMVRKTWWASCRKTTGNWEAGQSRFVVF